MPVGLIIRWLSKVSRGRPLWRVPWKIPRCTAATGGCDQTVIGRIGPVFGNEKSKRSVRGPVMPSVDKQREKRIVFIKSNDALSNRTDVGDSRLNLGIVDCVKCASHCYACQDGANRYGRS